MSSVLPFPPRSVTRDPDTQAWAIALAGFLVMMGPVYWAAAHVLWQNEDHAHGAIVLAVDVYLFWPLRHRVTAVEHRPAFMLGGAIFAFGLLVYVAGRMFDITIFQMACQIPVIAAALLLLKGPAGLRVAWFPLFYLIFMIPLPGVLVDAITGPLKQWISSIVVTLLYVIGYPIAQSGVVISIGQYQLLVADACSGLHSMFSLTALGTLFMYLMGRRSRLHNGIMLASILPIAFVANIIRVIILVLITYHLGDEAGQGFLHGTAGFVLMGVALTIFFGLDAVLVRLIRPSTSTRVRPEDARS